MQRGLDSSVRVRDAGESPVDAQRRLMLKALAGGIAVAASGMGARPLRAQATAGIEVKELRGGLMLVSGAGGNVVLLRTPDGAVQVDSGSPERAQDLAKLVAERFEGAPTRTLFNTSWRLPHTGGNETVAPRGATIISHENTQLWMSTKFYVEWEDRYYQRRKPEALPNKTFFTSDPQPLHADVGGVPIEYAQVPEAYTDGDLYVRFPQQNVIVAGGC